MSQRFKMFSSSRLVVGLGLWAGLLASCASAPEKRNRTFDPDTCNKNAGYEAGYNDGLDDLAMDTAFTHRCREDLREATFSGYKAGYEVGKKELLERREKIEKAWAAEQAEREKREREEAARQSRDANTNVNINIGGNQSTGAGVYYAKNYFCTISIFTKEYEAFGPTELEARRNVMNECKKHNHAMHCDEVECQRNQ